MLKQTFSHIPGISKSTELYLWKNNILSWNDFFLKEKTIKLNEENKRKIKEHLKKSEEALIKKDSLFFKTMPQNQIWRMYKEFKDDCCFLDIETTGLDKQRNRITTIGMFNGKESKVLINGKNLHEFEEEIKKYKLLITFNGKCFDIPFIQAKFPNAFLEMPHIDLRYVMASIGYTGGLKKIEKMTGIDRGDDLEGVDGYEAVRLWHKYERGDQAALEKLVKYNIADIENLKTLMNFAYDKLKEKNFLEHI